MKKLLGDSAYHELVLLEGMQADALPTAAAG